MSRHNYSQYSNKKNRSTNDISDEVTATNDIPEVLVIDDNPAATEATPVEATSNGDTLENVIEPVATIGVVANCKKLNIRVAPYKDSEVVCVVNAANKVEINVAESTEEWYCVCTGSGAKGYCMKQFVDVL